MQTGRELGVKCIAQGHIDMWEEEAEIELTTSWSQDNYAIHRATVAPLIVKSDKLNQKNYKRQMSKTMISKGNILCGN